MSIILWLYKIHYTHYIRYIRIIVFLNVYKERGNRLNMLVRALLWLLELDYRERANLAHSIIFFSVPAHIIAHRIPQVFVFIACILYESYCDNILLRFPVGRKFRVTMCLLISTHPYLLPKMFHNIRNGARGVRVKWRRS